MMSRRSSTGPTIGQRAAVMARAGNCCERCGRSIADYPADLHHRKPRRMGGTHTPAINDPHNVVAICRDCHDEIESHRTKALADGWLVASWDEPETVPLRDVYGQRFLLDDDGRVEL